MLNYAHQFIKSDQLSTRHIFETKPVTPNFYFISETSRSLSVDNRSLKKIYQVENFRANVLKEKEKLFQQKETIYIRRCAVYLSFTDSYPTYSGQNQTVNTVYIFRIQSALKRCFSIVVPQLGGRVSLTFVAKRQCIQKRQRVLQNSPNK